MIDLRSDTVTLPTTDMLAAMAQAEVGDDVFGEDPSVNVLQAKTAELFGMEAALFCPTGTMTNQIGIKVHTRPGDEVICSELAHIYLFEGGGIAANSGASVRLLPGDNGRFSAAQVRDNINPPDDAHYARTRLVSIENTVNKGGGSCWEMTAMAEIREVCDAAGLALHLDGARLFNALVAGGHSPKQYGRLFDTISVCLSKGLGAPVGSLLVGSRTHIDTAHRYRKAMGGGMRQAGFLAAAGIYALDNHIERLSQDHSNAKSVANELAAQPYVESVLPVATNIIIFKLERSVDAAGFLRYLEERQIKAMKFGTQAIRFVFHLNVSADKVDELLSVLRGFKIGKALP